MCDLQFYTSFNKGFLKRSNFDYEFILSFFKKARISPGLFTRKKLLAFLRGLRIYLGHKVGTSLHYGKKGSLGTLLEVQRFENIWIYNIIFVQRESGRLHGKPLPKYAQNEWCVAPRSYQTHLAKINFQNALTCAIPFVQGVFFRKFNSKTCRDM